MHIRKILLILAQVVLCFSMVSCGSSSSRSSNVKKVIESQVQSEERRESSNDVVANGSSLQQIETETEAETETETREKDYNVDLDLTDYTSTVADAYLRQLQENKDKYRGIIVKAKGTYSHFKDPDTGNDYYNCTFASYCCPNGLEFILKEGGEYPTQDGENIVVVGEFNYYLEDGVVYYNLINASIV